MKIRFSRSVSPLTFVIAAFCAGLMLLTTTTGQPQTAAAASPNTVPHLAFAAGATVPLSIQSSGVEWRGNVYHLLNLAEIRFDWDAKTNRLTATIPATVTSFDDVDYDVSAAVFDKQGALLGAARSKCHVSRTWLGFVMTSQETVALDFGVSLDYSRAATFSICVSNRKVLTPNDWQK